MNKLTNMAEFKSVLADYHVSDKAKAISKRTKFVLLTSVSSAGRNTIIRELTKTHRYHFVVSDTTRKPRVNDGVLEQDGREYWFKTEAEFLDGLRQGSYVEAAIIHNQQVSGVSVRELEKASNENKIAVSDIDVQGVDGLYRAVEGVVPVFVLPPNYKEWRKRLSNRGHMTKQELSNRLNSAKQELQEALEKDYYHFLVNDDLSEAVKGLEKIVAGDIDQKHEKHGKKIAQEILDDLKAGT